MASQILDSVTADITTDTEQQHQQQENKRKVEERLTLRILPDCAVATAVQDAHLVLLGADRISAEGDVSNKIGSLAAAVSAKGVGIDDGSPANTAPVVVVVSDVDKIVPEGMNGEYTYIPYHTICLLFFLFTPLSPLLLFLLSCQFS